MAAAGWNQETKARLSEKVAVNMNDLASLTKHVLRGSKSSDVSQLIVYVAFQCKLLKNNHFLQYKQHFIVLRQMSVLGEKVFDDFMAIMSSGFWLVFGCF